MDSDNKSPNPTPTKQNNEVSQSNGSKLVDLPVILNASKYSQEKQDNSELHDHENDSKQTPRSSFLKADGYRLNILNIIQSSLFKGESYGGPTIDKESPVQHQELREVIRERNSFVQLDIFPANAESCEDLAGPEELNRLPIESPTARNENNPTIILQDVDINENNIAPNTANSIVPNQNNSPAIPAIQQVPPAQNNQQQQEENILPEEEEVEQGINPKILRHIEFYVISLLLYIFAYIIAAKYVKIEVIFAIVTPLLVYYMMKVIKKKQPETLTIRQKRQKYFHVASLVFLTIYVIVGGIKIKYSSYSLAPAVIPGYLNIFAWLWFSDTVGYSSFCGKKVKIFFNPLHTNERFPEGILLVY